MNNIELKASNGEGVVRYVKSFLKGTEELISLIHDEFILIASKTIMYYVDSIVIIVSC